jgi:hypothetical protein
MRPALYCNVFESTLFLKKNQFFICAAKEGILMLDDKPGTTLLIQ